MFEKAPTLFTLSSILKHTQSGDKALVRGEWVPARPAGYFSLKNRFKYAWLVFVGKADALMWPEDL